MSLIAQIRGIGPQRIKALIVGFAGVHSLNAGLTLIYSLAQTLVFARVLPHRVFAMTILSQAICLYLLPISQSVARGNFVLLRERAVRGSDRAAPEAAAAYTFNKILLLLVALIGPVAIGTSSMEEYVAFACLMFYATYSNLWYFEIQLSLMAVDRALEFERVSFFRRVANYINLITLFFTHEFVLCTIAFAVQTLLFHLYVTVFMARGSGLFSWPTGLTVQGVRAHLDRLWVALQAVFAEWLTLNAPYAIFLARFGVGPGIITIDAVLKLLRMVLAVTRNLAEIALPRVSRALLLGDVKSGRWPAMLAIGGGISAAMCTAVAVTVWEKTSFGILLGPNNVVPQGSGAPAALTMLAGVGVAAAGHFIGHSGDRRAVPTLVATSIICVAGFASYVLIGHVGIVEALWASAISLSAISVVAVALLARSLHR
ncbi:hypothetical protein BH10PSE5_BH10PSE5_03290 [soil metagenome]